MVVRDRDFSEFFLLKVERSCQWIFVLRNVIEEFISPEVSMFGIFDM